MICQFSFKNFKSFKDETTFDFRADNINELSDTLIVDSDDEQFLPVSVVYGPNGGGKTTLLQALSFVINMVVSPIAALGKARTNPIIQQSVISEPFLFDPAYHDLPTEFNLFFRTNGNEYRYYLSILKGDVIEESLRRRTIKGKKSAILFEREGKEVSLGASLDKNLNTAVNPKMPYLSFLSINYDIPSIVDVQLWFESCIIRNYSNPMIESNVILFRREEDKKQLIKTFNNMDIDLIDFRFDETSRGFFVKHRVDDNIYELELGKESEGTKKLFAILPIIQIALQTGRLAIVDELDAKLHPKLLRYIIKLFSNKDINKFGAQLLFTSHDLSTMKNDVFRRDEIWFASLDEKRASKIFALSDIRNVDGKRVNQTASYDKQYLEGRYGADPYLQNMLNWES